MHIQTPLRAARAGHLLANRLAFFGEMAMTRMACHYGAGVAGMAGLSAVVHPPPQPHPNLPVNAMTPTPPLHPGTILLEDFMQPNRLTRRALADALHVSNTRIVSITRGTAAITIDTAIRLGHYFNTSPWFWMNLQVRFDLEMAEQQTPAPTEHIVPLPQFMDPAVPSDLEVKEWGAW